MWARLHKVDRIRPQPGGGAIILVEDERGTVNLSRVPAMSTLVAIARVLVAKQVLDAKYAGKGEIRYAPVTPLPSFLADAVTRAGAHISDRTGDTIVQPAQTASVDSLVDVAFAELAHHTRGSLGADLGSALKKIEAARQQSPLDREAQPLLYWPAVFELAALAGELSRSRGGRWISVREMPVPFAMKFPDSQALAHPTTLAQKIVEGQDPEEPRTL